MFDFEKKISRRKFLEYSAATCTAVCLGWDECLARGKVYADLVLLNGKILTINKKDQIAQAVAVKGNKIMKVGTNKQINSLINSDTNVIDLEGKTVTPGIVDSHVHVMYYGRAGWEGFLNVRYPAVKSLDDLLKAIEEKAKTTPNGQWISGNQGFRFDHDTQIDRWILDTVSPNHPVYLRDSSGQYSVANSLALEKANIDKNTKDPLNGKIMRNENGEPNGLLLHYPAENLVMTIADGYSGLTDKDLEDDVLRAQDTLLAAGITSGQDVIVGNVRDLNVYKNLADSNKLKMRIYTLLYVESEEAAQDYANTLHGYKTDYLTFAGWKLAIDGGPSAGTVLMYNNQLSASRNSYYYFDPQTLKRIVSLLHNTGLQIAFHIVGDKGIDETLVAIEYAMKVKKRKNHRHRIEHCIFVNPNSLTKMKKLGIVVSTSPQWISWHSDYYYEATDDATMENMMLLSSILKNKIPLAFGCDVPASITHYPKWALYGAITRQSLNTAYTPQPSQCLNIHQALYAHTMGSAYAAFEEKIKGSIEVNKLADMVVWSHDLYSVSAEDLKNVEALMTIVDGKIVYEKT
ncbi:MAG: amidohydrolase [Nitrospirae bacterium]|nr:amidohydrolase [Nitrospirota bacterium]